MSKKSNWEIESKVNEVFDNVVLPALRELVEEYDGQGGYEAEFTTDTPSIMGIERYRSFLLRHPSGLEMVVCIYWVGGSEKLTVENLRLVTRKRAIDLFTATKEEIQNSVKSLAGLGKK